VLNAIFVALVTSSVAIAAWNGRMADVMTASVESAKAAVAIAIGLLGMMALWLGFMRVLRDAGALRGLSRLLAPVMRRLFPDVPADHPAMGAMILNMASNMLGLGNAATPFGLKAMRELESLNPKPGVATDSMALFLAINTSGVAVMPLGVIAIRASMDSQNPGGIFLPSILATFCSTIVAIAVARALQKRRRFSVEAAAPGEASQEDGSLSDGVAGLEEAEEIATTGGRANRNRMLLLGAFAVAVIGGAVWQGMHSAPGTGFGRELVGAWILPVLMGVIALVGFGYGVKVYESVIKGAREGFEIFVMIIPFLVAILVAVGMFRASGALDALIAALGPVTALVGFPAEALPMALLRPLSGSGAMGVMTETMQQYGPDSFVGFLVSVMNGSTETTFYVLALYFGSVHVRATRHTVIACLCADFTGVAAALAFSRLFY